MAAMATFALKAGVWFRRGRRFMVSPDSQASACPLSGRNSTYRPVQNSGTTSVAVLLATRWIIAKLRNRQFFSITDLNDAIRDCVTTLNERVTRHLGASRRTLFDDVERTTLKPLPAEPYVYAEWKQCRAGLDYHVCVKP